MPRNLMRLGRTEVKRNPQLLFRLRKLLFPGLPYGGIPHEVILTIVTPNVVRGRGRTEPEKQAT